MRSILSALLFAAALTCCAMSSQAATRTWTGATGNDLLSDGNNWVGGIAPIAGDRIALPDVGLSGGYLLIDVPNATFDGIDFTGNSVYSVSGNPITLTGTNAVTVSSASGVFFVLSSVNFAAASPMISLVRSSGPGTPGLQFSHGAMSFSGGVVQVQAVNGRVELLQDIRESSPTAFILSGNEIYFTGNNAITGPIASTADILYASSIAPFGNANVLIQQGQLFANGNADGSTRMGPLSLLAPPPISVVNRPAGNLLTIDGTVTFDGPVTLAGTQIFNPVSDAVIRGAVSGNGGIRVLGATGWLELDNPGNSFTGDILVDSGGKVRFGASFVATTIGQLASNGGSIDIGGTTQTIRDVTCVGDLNAVFGAELIVTTRLDVGSCLLHLTIPPSVSPPLGSFYTIVENLTGNPFPSQFPGFPEGATVMVNGAPMWLTYHGGGNGMSFGLMASPDIDPIPWRFQIVSGDGQWLGTGDSSHQLLEIQVFSYWLPLANYPVRFWSTCATFGGASFVDVPTDSSGFAAPPMFFTAGSTPGTCVIHAMNWIGPGLPVVDFTMHFYDPATLRLTAQPPSVTTVVNQPFTVTIQVTDANGVALPDVPVNYHTESNSGANASYVTAVATDGNGRVVISATANGVAGNYQFVVVPDARGPTIIVPVTQTAPTPTPTPARRQDMWWSPTENGWGMSLVQHGDTLFGSMYVYDASGKPTWLVMPGGAWDATHTIYTGSLYTPTGTPFFAYDASRLVVGSAVGSGVITFQDNDHAILDYTIGGISGRKLVEREIFASGPAAAPDRSDLWWGGSAQNGWGIAVLQQAATLFSVWYTYDASGAATWYVMPGGTWTASDTYEGHVYGTKGSPWVGATYDPVMLKVFDAGTYRIQFSGDTATFTYTVDGHSGTIPLVREPF